MSEENKAGAAPLKKKKGGLSLKFKFASFTVLLIAVIMSMVGYTLFQQQKATLTKEVLERGRTIADGVAAGAKEALVAGDDLTLSVLVDKAIQPDLQTEVGRGFDFANPQDIFDGMLAAWGDLPAALNIAYLLLAKQLGQAMEPTDASKARKSIQNEGVYEAIVVNKDGMVAGYRSNPPKENAVGVRYVPPRYVEMASQEAPYPIYEQEWFDSGKKRQVRKLFDVAQPIIVSSDVGNAEFGTVHLGLDQGLIQRVVFDSTMKVALVALIALAAGSLFSYLIVSWMVSPIGKLVKGVLSIANGDFDARIKHKSGDELGELTNAFNAMAKSLSENEMLKGAFTRYVSDAALKQILSDPSKTGLHSRRALATVYTSDVRGFTSMSETQPPEVVVSVINTYLSLQTEIILKYEGVVDKFIGDATVAVFGKEVERDDDALRAVKAALEVQEAIAKMNKEREKRGEIVKQIGLGVNTGIVVAGNMGSTKKMEYTTAGENVILADKLCAECPGGKVWISESTYEMVSDNVIAEAKEPLKLKGRSEPFPVFEVTGLK